MPPAKRRIEYLPDSHRLVARTTGVECFARGRLRDGHVLDLPEAHDSEGEVVSPGNLPAVELEDGFRGPCLFCGHEFVIGFDVRPVSGDRSVAP